MRFAAFAAFFLSGASSLIFQNIWARMLHHVFGATGVAVSTVITLFMAGLGLGAWLAGRIADRLHRPLLAYALAEAIVGVWGLLVPFLVDPEGWLADVNRWLRLEMGAESLGFMLGRFACVVPVLLVPTTLMGASLPLLARHFVHADQKGGTIGSSVGALYSVNTFGAVVGVFSAGFVLMPAFGVSVTNAVAVSLNFAIALGIAAAHRWAKRRGRPTTRAPKPEAGSAEAAEETPPLPRWVRTVALVAFGVSGASALAYEVAWTRALAMTIGASVYSFALILVTFLIGIAGGSAVAAAVLWGRGRLLAVAALASVALGMLAAVPFGVAEGTGTWVLTSALVAAPVALVWRVAVMRRRSVGLPGAAPGRTGPALVMLATPCLAAVVNLIVFEGTLSEVVAAVVATVAVFVALLIAFRATPVLQLGLIQLFVGVATFVNYVFQDEIPCAFVQMVESLPGTAGHVTAVQFFMFLTCALCTLPATLGMGAMFPLTLRVWTASGSTVARDVGVVYASNTAGSILGAWLPGFILMPLVGVERTLHSGIWLNLALALLLVIASGMRGASPRQAPRPGQRSPAGPDSIPIWQAVTVYVLSPLIPVLAALLYLGTARPGSPLRWDLSLMTLGVFRLSSNTDACDAETWGRPDIVFYEDGLVTTVSVERWGRHLALKNNGKVDASNGEDMPTQIMVSGYPLLMHPDGTEGLDVAIVGFGSGVSVGSALQFPVDRVDVVELERGVVEASQWFEEVNNLEYGREEFPYATNDRLQVYNDDGRNFLASVDRKYDVIVSEPSNPWITGVSDLFTTDHFRITRRRLAPGGVYCQWVQLYELSPKNIKTIMRTFAVQFEHVVVFTADDFSSDMILVGSDEPLDLDIERARRAMAHPKVRQELGRAFIHSPYDVYARVTFANKQEVMEYTRIEQHREGGRWVTDLGSANGPDDPCGEGCRRLPAPLNTDDNARIEFSAPRDMIGYEQFDGYLATIYSQDWPWGRLMGRLGGLPDDPRAAAEAYARMAMALAGSGKKQEATQFLDKSEDLGGCPETRVAVEVLTLLLAEGREPPPVFEAPLPGPQLAPQQKEKLTAAFEAIREAVDEGAYEAALTVLEEVPAPLRIHSGPSLRFLHAYLLYKTAPSDSDRYAQAAEELEELLHSEERWAARHPELFYYLARAQDADFEFDRALRNMRRYVEALNDLEGASSSVLGGSRAEPANGLDGANPPAEREGRAERNERSLEGAGPNETKAAGGTGEPKTGK